MEWDEHINPAFIRNIASTEADLANYLSHGLIHLNNWFQADFLSLNLNKSCCIIFTGSRIKVPDGPENKININDIPIKRETHVKFLGIIIDEYLTLEHPHSFGKKQNI